MPRPHVPVINDVIMQHAFSDSLPRLLQSSQSPQSSQPHLAPRAWCGLDDQLYAALAEKHYATEDECIAHLRQVYSLGAGQLDSAKARARRWINAIRAEHMAKDSASSLRNFALTSRDGLAWLRIAEALPRINDAATADALIAETLGLLAEVPQNLSYPMRLALRMLKAIQHRANEGADDSADDGKDRRSFIGRIGRRLSNPAIRAAVRAGVNHVAASFIVGANPSRAVQASVKQMDDGIAYSFDCLGEGARTRDDAAAYHRAYMAMIDELGRYQENNKGNKHKNRFSTALMGTARAVVHSLEAARHGISVKLSALHPRYSPLQREIVQGEIIAALKSLFEKAKSYNLTLTIDAEESERLEPMLEIISALMAEMNCAGLGVAVQAYDKRAPVVINALADISRRNGQQLNVRLVKGAYWDREIRHAQLQCHADYPVFTSKAATDLSWLACAKILLGKTDVLNPIFATHNAFSVALVMAMAPDPSRLQFERLYGMGDELYRIMRAEGLSVKVYAPLGNTGDLLGYLVRRLIENGANASFVRQLYDNKISVESLLVDPAKQLDDIRQENSGQEKGWQENSGVVIKKPCDVFPMRARMVMPDISDLHVARELQREIAVQESRAQFASLSADSTSSSLSALSADEVISAASYHAKRAQPAWDRTPVHKRAECIERLATRLERERALLVKMLVHYAGKTIPDALAEIGEAVDICRYAALQARTWCTAQALPALTGETNVLTRHGRGIYVTISPWNFPLSIFLGQVTAALVTGNAVLAKPAPQTMQISATVAQWLIEEGVMADLLHVFSGASDIGAKLLNIPSLAGVAFTGSTATARNIARLLADREGALVPLIAETGGINAMIVDSSAVPEQVVDDVMLSAFAMAGQRCSSLRLLCVPHNNSERIISLLRGAVAELRVGDTGDLSVDVGGVIDLAAKTRLDEYVNKLQGHARFIAAANIDDNNCHDKHFVAPQIWEIEEVHLLREEAFGPILHLVTYDVQRLDALVESINSLGYGLTAGVQSRLMGVVSQVSSSLHVGNIYANRSIIGAMVEAQPFGGEALSGTGAKVGGASWLGNFTTERVESVNLTALGGNVLLLR